MLILTLLFLGNFVISLNQYGGETEVLLEKHLEDEYGLDDLEEQCEFTEEMINHPYSPMKVIEAYENDKSNQTQKTV